MDRKGHPIEYYPPCPASRMESTTHILKKLMETPAASTMLTYQSSKCSGVTQKTTTGKRLCRTKPSAAQVNQLISLLTLIFNFWSNSLLKSSSISSQSILSAKLLSQVLEWASANLSSAVPPKEPITVKITDVSDKPQVTEDEHLSISPPDATKVSSQAS